MAGTIPLTAILFLAAICKCSGQEPPPLSAEGRAETLRSANTVYDRFIRMHDPVVVTFGLAGLGKLVCGVDQPAGNKFAVEAYTELAGLSNDAFDLSPALLPVSNLHTLREDVLEAAKACGSASKVLDDRALDLKLTGEWQKANVWLNRALKTEDPARASQLAEAAFDVSNHGSQLRFKALQYNEAYYNPPQGNDNIYWTLPPEEHDLSLFVRVLAKIRQSAPDVADQLFQKVLGMMMAETPRTAAELGEMGKYLFPAGPSIQLPVNPRWIIRPEGGLPMGNFLHSELKGDFDLAVTFLSDAAQVVQSYQSDALSAFALAYQMPVQARILGVDDYAFRTPLTGLEQTLGSGAITIRAALGPQPAAETPDDVVLAGQALSNLRSGHFDSARGGPSRISNEGTRRHIEELIRLEEPSRSLYPNSANPQWDRNLASYPGSVRALVNSGLARDADTKELSSVLLKMAAGSADPLPENELVCVLPVLAAAALPVDPDRSLGYLIRLVKAFNDVTKERNRPQEGVQSISSEHSVPQCGPNGLTDFVTVGEVQLPFVLNFPGAPADSLNSFLVKAKGIELTKLESAVLGLVDETQLTQAVLAVTEAHLRFLAQSSN